MTEQQDIIKRLDALNAVLSVATENLQLIVSYMAPEEPNLRRPLEHYWGFNWASIGAEVITSDSKGAMTVLWNGHMFNRRYGKEEDKYGEAIWFSRGEGDNIYKKLITFRDLATPEPLTIKDPVPATFKTPADAIGWSVTYGKYKDFATARPVYENLKATENPKDATEMRNLWVAHVRGTA